MSFIKSRMGYSLLNVKFSILINRKFINLNKNLSKKCSSLLEKPIWTSNRVRKVFIDYFLNKQHVYVPSMSILNKDDKSLLFVNSGMNQFKPIFLNDLSFLDDKKKIFFKNLERATNYQKCVRLSGKHNDFDEVGKNFRHHTFFEMLGNWSFNNSYFKKEACSMALELLINHFKLDINNFIFTYFDGDHEIGLEADIETRNIWKNLNIREERIVGLGMKDNFWEMEKIGPCGICTEIYYIRDLEYAENLKKNCIQKLNANELKCLQLKVLSYCIEIWNLVFIQYFKDKTGDLKKLEKFHVDTGMGLERLLSVLNQTNSNYNTDLFLPLIKIVENEVSYENIPKYSFKLDNEVDIAYRIIADHTRTIVIMIADKCKPGNLDQEFCLRKLIRRIHFILRYTFLQKNSKHLFKLLVNQVINNLGEAYPQLITQHDHIIQTINEELDKYQKNIKNARTWLKSFKKNNISLNLEARKAFTIHKKFGLSKEVLYKITSEYKIIVDWDEFNELSKHEKTSSLK